MIRTALIFFSTCLTFYISAQESSKSTEFKAGIKAGINTSQMAGDGYAGFNKINPQAGFFLQKSFKEKGQLQFEIIYIQKGSRFPGDPDNGIFTTYRIQLDYIEAPLLYQYQWRKFLFEIRNAKHLNFSGLNNYRRKAKNPKRTGIKRGKCFSFLTHVYFHRAACKIIFSPYFIF